MVKLGQDVEKVPLQNVDMCRRFQFDNIFVIVFLFISNALTATVYIINVKTGPAFLLTCLKLKKANTCFYCKLYLIVILSMK